MNLFDTTQLGLERAIAGAGTRQAAIADNIANANTPGYRRVDVDFHGALASAMGDREKLEHTGFAIASDAAAGVLRADGSTVDVDAESAKLAANGLEYQALVQAAKGRIQIIESAMGTR